MTFRTIQTRFPGTCRRCGQPIAVGQRMRYAGRGSTWHLAAECPQNKTPSLAHEDPGYLKGGNYTRPVDSDSCEAIDPVNNGYNHDSAGLGEPQADTFCPHDSDDDCPF